MKLAKPTFFFAALLLGASAHAGDRCEGWTHKAYPVQFQACSYASGGSGYYVVENTGRTAASICWSVNFNDGRTEKGCNSNLGAGESTKGSCFSCGSKNSGADNITLLKYVPHK